MTCKGRSMTRWRMRRAVGPLVALAIGLSATGCGHSQAAAGDAAPGVTAPASVAPPPPQPLHQGAGALRGMHQLKPQGGQ